MSKKRVGGTFREIHTLWDSGAIGGLDDAELLERYAVREGAEAESAFAALVDRHGAIVLRTCKARLRDEHAAEDAFQATFLVLACRAGTLQVSGSLGPWLHSVASRVASSARSSLARRRHHEQRAAERADRSEDPGLPRDWETVLHEEINRLADRFRKPMVLCGLAGLSTSQAARQLGWPVGTVRSRLARGRERLRDRLIRRGIAPAVVAAGISATAEAAAPAVVSHALSEGLMRVVAQVSGAGWSAASFAPLVKSTLWGITMTRGIRAMAAVFLLGVGTYASAVMIAQASGGARQASDQPQTPTASKDSHASAPAASRPDHVASPRPELSLAEKLAAIKAEYDAQVAASLIAAEKAATPQEQRQIQIKMSPDEVAFSRRMVELATIAPKDPAARDALLWVIDHPGYQDLGEFGEEFARAASKLVRDHGDDPEAVRIGLGLDNLSSTHRDELLYGFIASAKGHAAKGLARLALGRYLQCKLRSVQSARKTTGRLTHKLKNVLGEDGKRHDVNHEQSDDEYAYVLMMRGCDPESIRAESERLLEEVVRDYGDVPCIDHRTRRLEELLKQPKPKWNNKELTADEIERLRKRMSKHPSLAEVAEGHIFELRKLAVGMPAPEINGVDFDGKPLKLSDFRGKVVALAFWGSWCGPCMEEVPHERELVEKYKGRPFAMLGVDCREPRTTGARTIVSERMDWPNWHDGEDHDGPIAKLYQVKSYPTLFVIDPEGKIGAVNARGEGLDRIIARLVAGEEAKYPKK